MCVYVDAHWAGPCRGASQIKSAITQALDELEGEDISGKNVTPYILQRINELTDGQSVKTNIELVQHNARVAAKVASKLCGIREARQQ